MADEKNLELNEKPNTVASELESSGISSPVDYDDLPDPDAGASDEERARLVRLTAPRNPQRLANVAQDKALVWKIDMWLIPWLSLLYLLSFLDRTNIGNARVAKMEPAIGMGGRDYNKLRLPSLLRLLS